MAVAGRRAEKLAELGERVLAGKELGLEEAVFLLGQDPYELAKWGRVITEAYHGKRVDLCSIVSGRSGRCPEDCKFCAQSAFYETGAETHPLLEEAEVLRAAEEAKRAGAHRFDIVVAGPDPGDDFEQVCAMLRAIQERTGLLACASLGALTAAQARELRAAGVTRYNHNVETTRERFPDIVSTHNYEDRLATLRNVRGAGMELCCGCIIGLGESTEERARLALEIRELEPEVVPLNVLNPIPGTPLEDVEPIPPLDIVRAIAMFRFVMPKAVIKLAGGRERNLRDLQALGVVAGANGLILGNYLTTLGRAPEEDLRMIADLGLTAELTTDAHR